MTVSEETEAGFPGCAGASGTRPHAAPPPPATAWDHQGPAAQGSRTVISISWGQAQEMGGLLSMSPRRRDSQQWWEAELRPPRWITALQLDHEQVWTRGWDTSGSGAGCRKVLGSAGSVGTPRGCGIPAWKSRCLNVGTAALYCALIRAAACSVLRSACLPCARLNLNRIRWNFQT